MGMPIVMRMTSRMVTPPVKTIFPRVWPSPDGINPSHEDWSSRSQKKWRFSENLMSRRSGRSVKNHDWSLASLTFVMAGD